MAELIHLIDDISTPVKLGWLAVLAWSAVQFLWFQHARVEPGAITESVDTDASLAMLARFTRTESDSAEGAASGLLSIAPAMDWVRPPAMSEEPDLGEEAGVALETLLETSSERESDGHACGSMIVTTPTRHLRREPRPVPSPISFESPEMTEASALLGHNVILMTTCDLAVKDRT
jgi:hypothetical protein